MAPRYSLARKRAIELLRHSNDHRVILLLGSVESYKGPAMPYFWIDPGAAKPAPATDADVLYKSILGKAFHGRG